MAGMTLNLLVGLSGGLAFGSPAQEPSLFSSGIFSLKVI